MYSFFAWLLQPFTLIWLLINFGLLLTWRGTAPERRRRLWLLLIPWLVLTLLMTPGVAYLLFGMLEWQYGPMADRPDDAQAIIVLGGGVRAPSGNMPLELSESGLLRCQRAAEIYQQGAPLPIFIAGTADEAKAMREVLVAWNVPDKNIIDERASTTTHENAAVSAELLQSRHLQNIILVTDAAHLPRAVRSFEKQGLHAVPAGCNYRARPLNSPLNYLAIGPHAAAASADALHEWLGMAWYWMKGRI